MSYQQFRQRQQPRFQHFDNNKRQQQEPGKFQDTDLTRLESLMEGMARSVTALVDRISVLEKGQPSQAPEVTVRAPEQASSRPNPWTLPSSARAGPSNARPVASAMPPATEPRTPHSLNPDFHKMCKALYYVCQQRRQTQNWHTLPASISRNLHSVASSIHPMHPSKELLQDIHSYFTRTGTDVRDRVARHYTECLDFNLSVLCSCNPVDKEKAVEIVTRQILDRLGTGKGRVWNVRSLVEGEAKVIGSAFGGDKVNEVAEGKVEVRDDCDTGIFRKTTKPAKKPCLMTTPPTLVSNPFSVLANDDNDDDDDMVEPDSSPLPQRTTSSTSKSSSKLRSATKASISVDLTDSPSPNRKSNPQRFLPPLPKSSPDRHVSFTPVDSTLSASAVPGTSSTTPQEPTATSSTTAEPTVSTPASSSHSLATPPRYSHLLGTDKDSWKVDLRDDTFHLIISDSNCRELKESDIPPGFQLVCLSGANFRNTLKLVQALPAGRLHNLILTMGINHKDELFSTRAKPAITVFFETCKGKAREIAAVGVSINPHLSESHVYNLSEVNNLLQCITNKRYIKSLPSNLIDTHSDMVHYTRNTQLQILQRTIQHITSKN